MNEQSLLEVVMTQNTWQQQIKTSVIGLKYFSLAMMYKELQWFCTDFELYEIQFARLRSTFSQEELEILKTLENTDEYKPCKACLIGMAFPSNEGYYLQGNQHSIMILTNKENTKEVFVLCAIEDGQVVFLNHQYTGNADDYIDNIFLGYYDEEDREYAEMLFFQLNKSTPETYH